MSQQTGSQSDQQQTISVNDLDIPQLVDVRKQLDEELTHLTSSFSQLKQAQAKFKSCIENVREINPQNSNKTVLIPLTNSLYVPGKISDSEHVIVDVGTGYFVKKKRDQAVKHYTAKVDYIQKNLETLEDTIAKKRENLNVILSILQSKIQAQTATGPRS